MDYVQAFNFAMLQVLGTEKVLETNNKEDGDVRAEECAPKESVPRECIPEECRPEECRPRKSKRIEQFEMEIPQTKTKWVKRRRWFEDERINVVEVEREEFMKEKRRWREETREWRERIENVKLNRNTPTGRIHRRKLVRCLQCDKSFKNNTRLLDIHMKQHNMSRFECKICGTSYLTRYNLNRHLLTRLHLSNCYFNKL